MKQVFFYRDYRGFTGGHLKVWHYFNHINSLPGFQSKIIFSEDTTWDSTNPWLSYKDKTSSLSQLEDGDYLFLDGMDWKFWLDQDLQLDKFQIINLMQHVRHADPVDPRFHFLNQKAMRICVSEQVEIALRATGKVNGPICTIPNGIELDCSEMRDQNERSIDILIVGVKRRRLARFLEFLLRIIYLRRNLIIQNILSPIPRDQFLNLLENAKMSVFLPRPTEGFYLPALEGMVKTTLVLCPDCIGNRGFCIDGETCFTPDYDVRNILLEINKALDIREISKDKIIRNARNIAEKHSLDNERKLLKQIFDKLDLW